MRPEHAAQPSDASPHGRMISPLSERIIGRPRSPIPHRALFSLQAAAYSAGHSSQASKSQGSKTWPTSPIPRVRLFAAPCRR
jgi:hypothetical protein